MNPGAVTQPTLPPRRALAASPNRSRIALYVWCPPADLEPAGGPGDPARPGLAAPDCTNAGTPEGLLPE